MNSNLIAASNHPPRRISFDNIGAFQALVGEFNKNIKHIEKLLKVRISVKGNSVSIFGDQPLDDVAERLIKQLYSLARAIRI